MRAVRTAAMPRDRLLTRLDASIILLVVLSPWRASSSGSTRASPACRTPARSTSRSMSRRSWSARRSRSWPGSAGATPARRSPCTRARAFVALTVINVLMIAFVIAGAEDEFGLAADQPGEAPIYLWTITRAAVAALLVIGAARSLRREAPPLPATFLVLAPAVVLVLVGDHAVRPRGVPAAGPGSRGLRPERAAGRSPCPSASTAVALVQVLIFVGFIVAAILFRRLYVRNGFVSDAFLSAGLVVAAFSQLHFAVDPVVAAGIVTSTDALRLVFYAILVMGIQAELEARLRRPAQANAELRRLSEVDAANATLAERTRLAREIHDGLAQDLWYAKLKQGRLRPERRASTRRRGRPPARSSTRSTRRWPRRARRSWRCASIRPAASSLEEVLRSYVEDFADRFGVRAEFEADGHAPAPAATDRGRGPAHRPGGPQQRPPPRRRDARPGADRARTGRSRASPSPTMDAGFDPAADRPAIATDCAGCASGPTWSAPRWTSGRGPADGTTVTVEVPTPRGRMRETAPLRVMLVDDHAFVRSAIRQALTAPDVEVVGEAATGEEALRLAPGAPPGHPADRHRPAGDERPAPAARARPRGCPTRRSSCSRSRPASATSSRPCGSAPSAT